MKRLLLVVVIAFTATSASYAQTIIPKVGTTLSSVALSDDLKDGDEIKSMIGFTLGVGLNLPVSEWFSIQPELNFIEKGAKTKTNKTEIFDDMAISRTGKSELSIYYLEVPVLAKITFGTNIKFFLNAGPSIGFGLDGNSKFNYNLTETVDGIVSRSISEDGEGNVKFGDKSENDESFDVYFDNRMDFGLQVGGGVLIANKVMVDVRYGFGLSNLLEKDDYYDNKSQHRVLQFTVGIPLSIGGK